MLNSNMNNLNGTILRVTTRYDNVYTYGVFIKELSNENWSNSSSNSSMPRSYKLSGGYAAELFLTLQKFLGFSYVLMPEVGPYNFSLAEEKSIDIYIGSYGLNLQRASTVNPTFVTGKSRVVAIMNHDFESTTQEIFILPFSKSLWWEILVFLFVSFVIISFIWRLEKAPFSDSFLHYFSTLVQKDSRIKCHKPSLRIAMFVLSISIVLIMACYTGNMSSMKAITRFYLNSIKKIVDSNYRIILELGVRNSSVEVMLKRISYLPLVRQLMQRAIDSKFHQHSFEETIQEVKSNPSVYIIDEETGISAIEEQIGNFPCSWSVMPVFDLKYDWVMYMSKRSSYRASINYGLLRLGESGLMKRFHKKWIPHASDCKWNSKSFKRIRLKQTLSAFWILFAGSVFAFVWLLLIECRLFFKLIRTN